ncbi:MAG: hypothetical protein N2515_04650, partial [Deltaproteobacteria bacterium]|nr:hypothetical protein [Deltaproteobacteria bacterium]
GVLFFEMVTGQLPFRAPDRETLLEMQRSAPPPRPRSIIKDLPEAAERIILRLLEKDPLKRYRDGHHLAEDLRALQRSLPSTTWEIQSSTELSIPPQPPPAQTLGVVEWSRRAAYFSRMLARAYPAGAVPEEVQMANDRLWEVAARASRLEGEIASQQRKIDAIERRGRALRAEIGRKVEDLAEEESRTLREVAAEREQLNRIAARLEEERLIHEQSLREMRLHERPSGDLAKWRSAFEMAVASKSKIEILNELWREVNERIQIKERSAMEMRRQIEELRAQLQRYGEALENELNAGKERIATKVREALSYEKAFMEASALLFAHLRNRPECAELLEELRREENQFALSGLASTRADITGSFRALS